MKKINKNINIVLIFILIGAFVRTDSAYSAHMLRVPMNTQQALERMDKIAEGLRSIPITNINDYLEILGSRINEDKLAQIVNHALDKDKTFLPITNQILYERLKNILSREIYNEDTIENDVLTVGLLYYNTEFKEYFHHNAELKMQLANGALSKPALIKIIRDLFDLTFERKDRFIVVDFFAGGARPLAYELFEIEKNRIGYQKLPIIIGIDKSISWGDVSSENEGIVRGNIHELLMPESSVDVVTMFNPVAKGGPTLPEPKYLDPETISDTFGGFVRAIVIASISEFREKFISVKDINPIIASAKRILKPGGRVYIAPFDYDNPNEEPMNIPVPKRYIKSLFRHGFIKIRLISPYPNGYPVSPDYGKPSCLIIAQKPLPSSKGIFQMLLRAKDIFRSNLRVPIQPVTYNRIKNVIKPNDFIASGLKTQAFINLEKEWQDISSKFSTQNAYKIVYTGDTFLKWGIDKALRPIIEDDVLKTRKGDKKLAYIISCGQYEDTSWLVNTLAELIPKNERPSWAISIIVTNVRSKSLKLAASAIDNSLVGGSCVNGYYLNIDIKDKEQVKALDKLLVKYNLYGVTNGIMHNMGGNLIENAIEYYKLLRNLSKEGSWLEIDRYYIPPNNKNLQDGYSNLFNLQPGSKYERLNKTYLYNMTNAGFSRIENGGNFYAIFRADSPTLQTFKNGIDQKIISNDTRTDL